MLQLQDITYVYNQGKENALTALNGINLEIERGALLAIVGESGSGKSTLLHVMGGLDVPIAGEVIYNGEKLNYKNSDWLAQYRNKEVGFVLQDFGLLLSETVLENVCVPLLFSKGSFIEMKRKAKDALKLVGIDDLASRKVGQLSGGQKQRVAIARALVNNPNIILADEPTGALDSKTSLEIVSILIDLNKQGKTVIIVTHDLSIAQRCQRMVTIADGEIV
ncbi:MAG: ABC transporter ATP-binding protein [Lachnospiraceae bacterium]|nr:ABC transporter ATP-binding protein [Lachnospiraceae bacterium]